MSLTFLLPLILLSGWLSSRLFHHLRLPPVLGLLICGLLLGTLGEQVWPVALVELEPFLKTFALVVILLRAGLGLRRKVLNQIGRTALALSILPCLLEGSLLTLLLHFFFHFSWPVAGLTAFMLSAVSPAVVVPAMLNLSEQGYGKKNQVPTLILAGASADDVLAITLFSVCVGMATQPEFHWLHSLWELPRALILGILPGIAVGLLLAAFFHKNHQRVRATEKTLVLLMVALLLVQAGEMMHSAALLGIMTVGFILLERAEPVAHELAAKLSKIWIFAEIMLFMLIGMKVDPQIALRAGPAAIALLCAGLLARSLGVWIATLGSPLTRKERFFCVCAYWPKATVQAALGSVPLALGIPGGETILALAVLAVLFTAPLGLFAIRIGGPKLLDLSEIEA
ncbi:cation:proton antiporter [Kiritimatiellaeota bacterium B1221]|nr:cation:proton antiporter [Kiritimatiellaeota bacterium B1221]